MLKSKYPIVESIEDYANPFFSVVHEKVKIDHKQADFYIVHKKHYGVYVVPVHNEKILLINQYRQHTRTTSWEVPAGGSKDLTEDPLVAAKHELEEETGYSARELKLIGTFYTLPGLSNMIGHVVVAQDLHSGAKHLEFSEDISKQKFVSFDYAKSMIAKGDITDAMTITALHYFFLNAS